MIRFAEYIWLDGAKPTSELRSKTRVINTKDLSFNPTDYPKWSYDGSSTNQASGNFSDVLLLPSCVVKDPIRGDGNVLVLCEVLHPDNSPHHTNTRAKLRKVLDNGGAQHEALVGFEQEYTLFDGRHPLGWPDDGYPGPQGPFYCGVGADKAYGRNIVEQHMKYCVDADLCLYGINAEVMPGQWEYQVGYRGFDSDNLDVLTICDHQMIARWLLCRVAEDHDVRVSFNNKPVAGDWNGAGCHTNFSTKGTRDPKNGYQSILEAIDKLSEVHDHHIANYGHNLAMRLTGQHETCSISEFRFGISDRGASVRIPSQVKENGHGYFEDRRPGANCDPYIVVALLITTCCGLDAKLLEMIDNRATTTAAVA